MNIKLPLLRINDEYKVILSQVKEDDNGLWKFDSDINNPAVLHALPPKDYDFMVNCFLHWFTILPLEQSENVAKLIRADILYFYLNGEYYNTEKAVRLPTFPCNNCNHQNAIMIMKSMFEKTYKCDNCQTIFNIVEFY